ncbi:MAG TPA: beta-propeller fold lactonase family protein [Candidatus Binatus sp.]|nr:beta-propeller fold lactonase family protein [Candidatus Binatus sp.]
MERIFIQCSALTVCAAATLALLAACDNDSKKIVTPPITPKFLYASSCGTASAKAAATSRLRHPQRGVAHVSPNTVGTGGVDGYSVDPTTGALTPLTGSPVATGMSCPEFLTTDPGQKFLFVPDEGNDLLHAFTIGSTGALTEVSGSPYSQCVFQLAVDPSGKYLVAPDFCNNNIAVYTIGSDGSLSAVAGSPFAETSGNEPETVFIDPTGQWVYVADVIDGPGTISAFALSSAGALTQITGSPFASGQDSYAITGTPDGKYLYLNNLGTVGSEIIGFSVNSTTGALTALTTPAYPGGNCWDSVDVSGAVLFTTDCNGNVLSSVIGSDGSLTTATGSPFTAGVSTWPVVGDPSSKFVYAGDDNSPGQIFAYTYTAAGVLAPVSGSPFTSGTYIEGIVVTH